MLDVASVAKRARGENFPVASLAFPRELRPHIRALYAYARLVDILGDELEGGPEARLTALDELELEVDAAFRGAGARRAGAGGRRPFWGRPPGPRAHRAAADDPRVRPPSRAVPAPDRGES